VAVPGGRDKFFSTANRNSQYARATPVLLLKQAIYLRKKFIPASFASATGN